MAVEGESIHVDNEIENSADEAIKEHESQQILLTLESILFTFVANVLLYSIVFSWMVFYQLARSLSASSHGTDLSSLESDYPFYYI